jgi:hypothetical protein
VIGLGDELRLAQTDAILSGTRTHCQPALPFYHSDNRRSLFEFHALTFQFLSHLPLRRQQREFVGQ